MNDVQYYIEYNAGKALKVILCLKIKNLLRVQKAFY